MECTVNLGGYRLAARPLPGRDATPAAGEIIDTAVAVAAAAALL